MPYRTAPAIERTSMPGDLGARWSLVGIALFFLPTWDVLFACGSGVEPGRLPTVAAVTAVATAIIAVPFAIGLLWAMRGGDAARGHVACVLAAAIVGCGVTQNIAALLAIAFYGVLLSMPAIALRHWQNTVRSSRLTGRIQGLQALAKVGIVFAIGAFAPAVIAGSWTVATSAAVLAALGYSCFRLGRERDARRRRFYEWLAEVRDQMHPGYAIVPATDYRETIPWVGSEAQTSEPNALDAEWLVQDGQPVLRIGAPAPLLSDLRFAGAAA